MGRRAGLTDKQRILARAFIKTGSIKEAAAEAGFAHSYARDLMTRDYVKAEVERLRAKADSSTVMALTELKEFWTTVIRDEEEAMGNRLRASQYLGQSHGAFLDRVEHSGAVAGDVSVTINRTVVQPHELEPED